MGLLKTDIVASVSGTLNEILTMTTQDMTKNQFRYHHIIFEDEIYVIASNTTSTITLETPDSAYEDLSNETVEVHVNYTNYKRFKQALGGSDSRPGGWSIGDALATTKEIIGCLDMIDEKINEKLCLEDEKVNSLYFLNSLKSLEVDIMSMNLMRNSHFRRNNPGENAPTYWSVTPEFTRGHLATIRSIKKKLANKNRSSYGVYNINNGSAIN